MTFEFVNAYKNFETTLRNTDPEAFDVMKNKLDVERFMNGDFSVLSFENALTDIDTQQKVKLIRITRNYIQHHNDGDSFAAVSEPEIAFLNALSKEIQSGCKNAGDIAVKALYSRGEVDTPIRIRAQNPIVFPVSSSMRKPEMSLITSGIRSASDGMHRKRRPSSNPVKPQMAPIK